MSTKPVVQGHCAACGAQWFVSLAYCPFCGSSNAAYVPRKPSLFDEPAHRSGEQAAQEALAESNVDQSADVVTAVRDDGLSHAQPIEQLIEQPIEQPTAQPIEQPTAQAIEQPSKNQSEKQPEKKIEGGVQTQPIDQVRRKKSVWPSRIFGLIACSALAWFWWWLLKPSPPAPPPPAPPSAQNKSTAKKADAKKVDDKKVDAKKADGPAGRTDTAKAPVAAAPPATPAQQTGPVPSLNSVLADVDMDAARKYISAMLIAASDGNEARIEDGRRSLQQVRAPQRGDRVTARALNVTGLDAVRRGQFGAAVNIFLRAAHADPGDQEIMNNLAHALFKNGQLAEGRSAAIAALVIAPERTTAWAELAQILASEGRTEMAIAGFLLCYRYSKDRNRTRDFLLKITEDGEFSANVRSAATQTLNRLGPN